MTAGRNHEKTSAGNSKEHREAPPHLKHGRVTGRTEGLSELVALQGHGLGVLVEWIRLNHQGRPRGLPKSPYRCGNENLP